MKRSPRLTQGFTRTLNPKLERFIRVYPTIRNKSSLGPQNGEWLKRASFIEGGEMENYISPTQLEKNTVIRHFAMKLSTSARVDFYVLERQTRACSCWPAKGLTPLWPDYVLTTMYTYAHTYTRHPRRSGRPCSRQAWHHRHLRSRRRRQCTTYTIPLLFTNYIYANRNIYRRHFRRSRRPCWLQAWHHRPLQKERKTVFSMHIYIGLTRMLAREGRPTPKANTLSGPQTHKNNWPRTC